LGKLFRSITVFLSLFGLLGLNVLAQTVTGTIVGTVTDPSGSPIANASVTVTNTATQELQKVTTDNGGHYTATLLPIGRYDVAVEAKGFKREVKAGIVLNVNDKLTVDLAMQIGNPTELVNVEAAPVQVQLQQGGEQSTTINGTEVRELALITRNWQQLISIQPGVTQASVDQLYVGNTLPSGTAATIPFSINGTRNSQSEYLVDGGDIMDRGSDQTLVNTPSIDSIAEFKVMRTGYSADIGRAAGGVVTVVTKSGTNDFHGDLFEFVRNNDFAANNFENNATGINVVNGQAQVAPLHYNNFGWTLGGPVWIPKVYNGKNKTFFFFSQEFRRYITYSSGAAVEPTQAETKGIFPNPVCIRYTGSTCAATSNTIGAIDPVAQQYIRDIYSRVTLPTGSNTLNSLFRNQYYFEQELYKLDQSFGDKLRISARYLRDQIPTIEPQGLFSLGETLPNVGNTSTNSPGRNWAVRATSSFTPTWLNEIGWDFTYGAIISNPIGLINSTYSPDIKTNLPFPVTLTEVPNLSFASGTALVGFGPYRDYNRNHNIFDNVTKILGNHTVRFGMSYNHYEKSENAASGNQGTFTFTPASVPAGATQFQQAFANFLLGNVATFTQVSEDITPDIKAQQFEFYLQDDWRVTSKLTLNVGARYSNFRQPVDNRNELTNFDPALYNRAAAPAFTASGLLAAGTPYPYLNGIIANGSSSPFGRGVSSQDNSNIGPRFGFAWDPHGDGKTAIRGGYGIFFDATLYGIYEQNIFANPPYLQSATILNTTLDNPAGGTATVSNSPVALHATPSKFQTPYTQSWSLEVQRQLTPTTLVNVAYVGNKGTHLFGEIDLNQVYPGLAYTSGVIGPNATITSANTPLLNPLRPYPGYNAINAIEPWFNSNYNSLQVYGKKQLTGDSVFTASYTWSHNNTDNQTDRSTAAQNTYNFNAGEYGPAQYDRRQVFVASIVYTLPFFRDQKGFTGKVLGGWEASAIANYYTGLPYTVTTSGVDPAGLGILGASASSLRPNVVAGCQPNEGPQTRLEWFNTACFAPVPAGVHIPGNAGRGIIRGPGYEGWNISASKNLIFHERFRFQLRGEAENAFNQTNPSTFGSLSTTSTLFGVVTGYRDPRIIQLGAKFYF
jgi:outer membrane receptor protein involved in Fe transport